MAKSTIGQFLSALRRANGLTQQDVADRLNVSNKAVSRWERDECAPDISLIPALAEMFDITCDELLKGERNAESACSERKEPKVDKQVRALLNRTITGFKTLNCIAVAVACVGIVCMFGISYGFYRPMIGFAVMLLFEICAFALTALAVSKAKDIKEYNELFQMADHSLKQRYNSTLGNLSFWSFFAIFGVLLLSFPFAIVNSASFYLPGVMTLGSYFVYFFVWIALVLALIALLCRKPYVAWATDTRIERREPEQADVIRKTMTGWQVGLTVLAAILVVLAPYCDFHPQKTSAVFVAIIGLGLACMLGNVVVFAVFLVHQKNCRKGLLVPGIRNTLFILCALVVSQMHKTAYEYWPKIYGGISSEYNFTREDIWSIEYLLYAIVLAGWIYVLFEGLGNIIKKKQRKTNQDG